MAWVQGALSLASANSQNPNAQTNKGLDVMGNLGNQRVKNNTAKNIFSVIDYGGGLSNTFNLLSGGKLFDGDEEQTYDPYWAYTPEQKAIHQSLGPYLNSKIGAAADLYKGDYTAPMTQAEQDVLTQNARMSALGEQGLANLLKGEFPEQYYRDTIYQPALKNWQEDILPTLNESYAGPSGAGFYGSAKGNAAAKSARDLTDTLAAKRGELAWNVQQNVPNAINAANALSTTGAAIQSTPRLIQQYGLDQQYKEWTRGQEENQKYIDQALAFMGLSSGVMDVGNTPINEGGGINLNGLSSLISALGNNGSNSNYDNYVQTQTQPDYGTYDYYSNYPTGGMNYGGGSNSYSSYGNMGSYNDNYTDSAINALNWKGSGNLAALGSGNYQ
jgi:hypothetical protein